MQTALIPFVHERFFLTFLKKGSVLLIVGLSLSACVTDGPHNNVAEVTTAQSAYVPNTTNTSVGTGTLTAADTAQQIAADQQSIRAGLAPPDIIKYDLEIAKMMPEAQEILAAHDRERARVWQNKYRAIVEARNKAVQDFLAPSIARNNAIINTLEASKASRCLDAMGHDLCHAAPAQQSQVTYPCPTGPGPGEAQVGEGQGGEPICRGL
ncbi:hypothetical protein [Acidisoma cladoniae]|jgi:hypothetical protein|uniref:hypothetical protein n=1 Tax=Acidisoma cladoniae TaxID=3040935 RepID=UPI0025502798|nr:hypothetical protein [Acidisoma sp. PAMC 29798]